MVTFQRTPVAAVWTGALICLPRGDLNADKSLLDSAVDLLGLRHGQPKACRTKLITVDPDDLMDIPSVARVVDEDDLYRHPNHEELRAMVNACRNAPTPRLPGNSAPEHGMTFKRFAWERSRDWLLIERLPGSLPGAAARRPGAPTVRTHDALA